MLAPLDGDQPASQIDLWESAERLLTQGADKIEGALAQDSAFLAANRQRGGQ